MKLLARPITPIIILLKMTMFLQNIGIWSSATVTNGAFDHPNFIVYFDGSPFLSKGLIINDVEDFLPMIKKISSEFSQIFSANKSVAIAVATHNKLLSMKNVSQTVYQKPLEVYLRHSNKWEKGNGTTFVDNLVEVADKANDIFPGTVKYLFAYHTSFYKEEFKKRWSLSESRKRFMDNTTHHTYKLGIVFQLEECEKEILEANSTLSDYVQLVGFVSRIIYKYKNNLTVEESFAKLKTQFEFCAITAKSFNPKVELVFQTGFSDTDPRGEQDYSALVTFWEMLNDWAISTNVKVTIFEAFDTPDSGIVRGTRGLWKLTQAPKRYHIPADFTLMDKRFGNSSNVSAITSPDEAFAEMTGDLDFKHDNFVVDFDSTTISKYDSEHYYHHDDFLPIIRTIANKFSSVCLTEYNPDVIEAVAIHNSLTIQNMNRSNSYGLSQPLRVYQLFEFSDKNNLNDALKVAEAANSLFSDTVEYLILETVETDKLFSYVSNAGENIINHTVRLAMHLPLLDCLRGTSRRMGMFRLLSYMKLIYLTIGTKQEDYDEGVEETVIGLTKAFAICKKRIENISGEKSLKFAFGSSWSDTDFNSIQNLSNLVSFWGKMNNWAKITNTVVIMTEAFDETSEEDEHTYGWWRLASTPRVYHSIAEYVYEDKTETRNKIRNGIPYVVNSTSLNGKRAFQQEKWKVTNASFSRTNFIVEFSPIIRKQHATENNNKENIRKIISKLFTRFSSICTDGLQKADLHYGIQHISLETAANNLENKEKHLYVHFTVEKDDSNEGFQLALSMAKMANSISAGTVEYLIVFNNDGYLDDSEEQANYFTKAKDLLREDTTTLSCKLGYIYSISECGHGTNVNKEIILVLKVLDLIVFDMHAEDGDYEVGVYESIRGFTKQFERCKKKISQLNSSIEVAFRTSWSDTNMYNGQNFENLVLFWEKMNEWAVSTNTKIFMLEAFDSQKTESLVESKLGWWRLLSEEIRNGSANYIFEEKREVVLGNLGRNKQVEGQPRTALISVLISLVVSALIIVSVVLFVYRRYKSKLAKAQKNILTKQQEAEFLEGVPHPKLKSSQKLGDGLGAVTNLPKYDMDYEVKQGNFEFDEANLLGSGEFGIVCKGTVMKSEQEIDVAVKTLKKSSSKTVKNLLTEIKVMIHLGKHENIISIIGAHTEGMRRGKVLLFTELCEKGSLENYLRELRRQNVTAVVEENETKVNQRTNKRGSDELDQIDLYHSIELQSNSQEKIVSCADESQQISLYQNFLSKWSYEIANGMEFIVSKKVVHADLATRNVLLTDNLTAKISDFGLSRRLFNYTEYVKTQKQPLPWKWMSPESLRRSEFNEKTDVWAFGITIWEIYSLGDAPYPGLPWTPNFASVLEGGLRPQEPEFNANSIYTVMLRCWNNDPKNRPTFIQLKEILNRLSL